MTDEIVKKEYKRLPLNSEGKLLDLGNIKILSPQNLTFISFPKSGKTLTMVNVPKILIADSEGGTNYFAANNKVNLLDPSVEGKFFQTKKYGYIPQTLYDLVTELYEANRMAEYWQAKMIMENEKDIVTKEKMYDDLVVMLNKMPFPILAIDTITSIITLSNSAALYEYNLSVKPDSKKSDIKKTDDYGGVNKIRAKFDEIKRFIEQNAAPFIIYSGHIGMKKKLLKKEDSEANVLDIALEGVLSTIFTSKSDSVATFFRNEDGCFLDFQKKEETALGSRPEHLSNKLIKIAEIIKPDQSLPVTHWNLIYPEINFSS